MTKRKKAAPRRASLKTLGKAVPRTPVADISPDEQIVGALFLGKLRSFEAKTGTAGLVLEAPLAAGDTIRVKGRATDLTQKVERLEVAGRGVPSAEPGEAVSLILADRVKVGDAAYKL